MVPHSCEAGLEPKSRHSAVSCMSNIIRKLLYNSALRPRVYCTPPNCLSNPTAATSCRFSGCLGTLSCFLQRMKLYKTHVLAHSPQIMDRQSRLTIRHSFLCRECQLLSLLPSCSEFLVILYTSSCLHSGVSFNSPLYLSDDFHPGSTDTSDAFQATWLRAS